ncbi:MAG TPA: hypothetical protein VM513_16560 [Kofleriaceae bacterium]|jgi:hypothetical protein|nr:hypothetical protein [Kofleriaceae bacterium]
MRSLILCFVIGLVLVLGATRSASACDCAVGPTDRTLLDKSAAIFVGRVIEVFPDYTGARLQILATWRGVDAGATITVRSEASDCGFHFTLGESVLLFTNAKHEASQCTLDQDARPATAASLAFLGAPKAAISDDELARCPCKPSSPVAVKKNEDGFEYRVAGKSVADGRYALSIPLSSKRPKDRFKDAPIPTRIITPAGGCALVAPKKPFWFARTVFGEAATVNACIADQLQVKK